MQRTQNETESRLENELQDYRAEAAAMLPEPHGISSFPRIEKRKQSHAWAIELGLELYFEQKTPRNRICAIQYPLFPYLMLYCRVCRL
jgi:hypothetical protein